MKKGAYFKVIVYVEGDDEAAHNFAAEAQEHVRDLLGSGRFLKRPDWEARIESVEETEKPGEWDLDEEPQADAAAPAGDTPADKTPADKTPADKTPGASHEKLAPKVVKPEDGDSEPGKIT